MKLALVLSTLAPPLPTTQAVQLLRQGDIAIPGMRDYNATTTAVGLPYACVEIDDTAAGHKGDRAETPEACAETCANDHSN